MKITGRILQWLGAAWLFLTFATATRMIFNYGPSGLFRHMPDYLVVIVLFVILGLFLLWFGLWLQRPNAAPMSGALSGRTSPGFHQNS